MFVSYISAAWNEQFSAFKKTPKTLEALVKLSPGRFEHTTSWAEVRRDTVVPQGHKFTGDVFAHLRHKGWIVGGSVILQIQLQVDFAVGNMDQ